MERGCTRSHRLDVSRLLGRRVVWYSGRALSRFGAAVLVRRLDQGLYSLDKQRLSYRVDDSRRVEVVADQYDQAADVVSKLDWVNGPSAISEKNPYMSSFFDSAGDKENRRQLAREKIIEGLIGQLDGVVWSLVSIDRSPSSKWLRTNAKPTAFVYIETEGNRQLPYQTAQAISGILTGNVRDLTPGSITVMDRHGVRYLDSGNPAIGVASRDRRGKKTLSRRSSTSSTGSRECGSRSR